MADSVLLSVGESCHLRRGRDRIIYAGMPSGDVYSIVQRKSRGYQGFSWNLFYPVGQQEIVLDGVRVFVEDVSPREIRLRIG